jgi:hypothetical protein
MIRTGGPDDCVGGQPLPPDAVPLNPLITLSLLRPRS